MYIYIYNMSMAPPSPHRAASISPPSPASAAKRLVKVGRKGDPRMGRGLPFSSMSFTWITSLGSRGRPVGNPRS